MIVLPDSVVARDQPAPESETEAWIRQLRAARETMQRDGHILLRYPGHCQDCAVIHLIDRLLEGL